MAKLLKMVAICLYWACGSAVRLEHGRSDSIKVRNTMREADQKTLRDTGGDMACLTNYLYEKSHGEDTMCGRWKKGNVVTVPYWSNKHHMALFTKTETNDEKHCAIGFSGGIATGRQLLNLMVGTVRAKTCDIDIDSYEAIFNKEFFKMTEELVSDGDADAIIKELEGCTSLKVTGHGLGGAMASIFAVCLTAGSPELGQGTLRGKGKTKKFENDMEVYTFGAPPALVGAPPRRNGLRCWEGARFLVANTGWYDPVPYAAAAIGFEFLRTPTVSLSYTGKHTRELAVDTKEANTISQQARTIHPEKGDELTALWATFVKTKAKSDLKNWEEAVEAVVKKLDEKNKQLTGEHYDKYREVDILLTDLIQLAELGDDDLKGAAKVAAMDDTYNLLINKIDALGKLDVNQLDVWTAVNLIKQDLNDAYGAYTGDLEDDNKKDAFLFLVKQIQNYEEIADKVREYMSYTKALFARNTFKNKIWMAEENYGMYYSCADFDLSPPQNEFTGVGVGYVHQGWAAGAGLGVGAGVGPGLGVGLGVGLMDKTKKSKLKFEGAGNMGMGIGLGGGAGAGSLSGLAVGLLSGKGVPCTWWFDGPRCPSYSAHDAVGYMWLVRGLKLRN